MLTERAPSGWGLLPHRLCCGLGSEEEQEEDSALELPSTLETSGKVQEKHNKSMLSFWEQQEQNKTLTEPLKSKNLLFIFYA